MADLTGALQAAAGTAASAGGAADPNFNQTVLLLHGDGTNGAQNNTFLDSSTNNFTITRNGNTTQGTFSPFSAEAGKWSNYLPGSGSILYTGVSTALSFDADFTVEGWFNLANFANASAGGNPGLIGFGTPNWVLVCPGGEYTFYANNSVVFATSTVGITANTWHHFALVRSGSTITMYHNGVSVATATNSNTLNIGASGVTVGSNGTGGIGAVTGYVSNIRVVKGTAVYTSAFTPPTGPLTAIANTQLLVCQSNRFKDNSSNNFSVTLESGPSVQPFSPFAPSAAYSPSVNGGSGYFDGSGDYLSIADAAGLRFGTGNFTIQCWIYRNAAGAVHSIAAKGGASTGWVFQVHSDNKLRFTHTTTNIDSTGTIPASAWTHVAVVREGTGTNQVKLYINGVQDGQGTVSTNFTQTEQLNIGADRGNSNVMNGYIAGFKYVVGTAETITVPTAPPTGGTALLNFTNAGIFDNTGKNNLETVGNAQIDTTTKKYGTGSMEFDGTGDWLLLPSNTDFNFGSGNWTIEAWVYFNGTPGSGNSSYSIVSKWDATINEKSFVLRLTSSTGTKAQILCSSDGSTNSIATGSTGLSSGTWYHIAAVQNSGTVTLYVNGSSDATVAVSSVHTNNQRVYVGASLSDQASPVQPFNGFIDDLRITRGVARYTTTFTPPTAALPDL